MCCEDCEDLKLISIFFGTWNIFFGLIFSIYALVREANFSTWCGILVIVLLLTSILHTLSGLLTLLGILIDNRVAFLLGIILSNFMPVMLLFTIFIPVLHLVCVIKAIKYYKSKWVSSPQI